MNKKYFEQLENRAQNGKPLTKTELKIYWAYRDMLEYEHDWLGIEKVSDIEPSELAKIMKEADLAEVYIEACWSDQFENWFGMQQAGFEIVGVKEVDNPRYAMEVKVYGKSSNRKKKHVLAFKI